MGFRFFVVIALFTFCVAMAIAQPMPVEVYSYKSDSIKVINGPDGKPLPDGAPVFVIRSRTLKHEIPQAKTGISDTTEFIIQRSIINPAKEFPGSLSLVITAADNDRFLLPTQAIKGEKIYFRVFATTDTTLPSGTMYSDTDFYVVPTSFGQIEGVHFGEWKQIP